MNMSQKVTFQWSRLIKDLETGEADENAVKFYQDVIDECRKNDIILVLNLHHFVNYSRNMEDGKSIQKQSMTLKKMYRNRLLVMEQCIQKPIWFHRSGFRNTETYSEKIWRVA